MSTGDESAFMARIYKLSWIVFIVATAYQCLFHLEVDNLVANFCVGIGWGFSSQIFLRRRIMWDFPLSSFLILAFSASQLYLPLLFTTLEGKSLVYNLELPEQVFFHSLASLLVVSIAHAFYRFLVRSTSKNAFPLMTWAGFFTPPTKRQLWLMGIVGLAASYYVYFINPDVGAGITEGTAVDKVIQGCLPFSYAPFFMLVDKLYGRNSKLSPLMIALLAGFTIVLFALSIGRNSRGAFMTGLTSVAFAYGLGLLLGVFHTRLFTLRNAFIGGILVWLLTGPIADLGTAMVIVRAERDEIPAAELIDLTLEAYQDKNAIRLRRLEDNSGGMEVDWDERYLDNIFTARFANIKFSDLSLSMASELDPHDPNMLNHSLDYLLGALPEPFLKAANFEVDKETVYSMSMGDYLYMITGGQGYIAGYRTGHYAGISMATFGWWYLLLLGVGMVPIFFLFDLFHKKTLIPDGSGNTASQFSLCGLLALWSIWGFLGCESLVSLATYIIRGWFQLCLLYLVLFHVTRLLSGSFNLKVHFR